MRNPFRQDDEESKRDSLKLESVKLDRLFETRSHEWEKVGLEQQVSDEQVRKARRDSVILVVLLAGVLAVYHFFGHDSPWVKIGCAAAFVLLGWAFGRDIGRAAGPTFFRRVDPSTAGTLGFVIRLATVAITILGALAILGVKPAALALGGSITAIIIGLAAQQPLGNLFAGMVLLSARPFQVGTRVRLQAGQLGGSIDGVVSSLGLLYTTLVRGQDVIMIPNTVVLASVVMPVREPDPVDVTVRLRSGIRASTLQEILDQGIRTPTQREPRVLLQEIDGDHVVLRILATPEQSGNGAKLADEIIAAIQAITGEQDVVVVNDDSETTAQDATAEQDATAPQGATTASHTVTPAPR
jgi:small-conductance mechanosensitive channel